MQSIIADFSEEIKAAQKFGGVKRDNLKDSDFVIPSERKFPVMTSQDVKDAVSSFGRYKGSMTYDEFKSKLVKLAKRKGLTSALPQTIKDEFNIKASFELAQPVKDMLMEKSEAAEIKYSTLEEIFELGFQACANFYRPGKRDAQFALARVNRFIKTKDKTLTKKSSNLDYSDIELTLASIELSKFGVKDSDVQEKIEREE